MNMPRCLWNIRPEPTKDGTLSSLAHSDKMLLMLPHAGGSAQSYVGWKNWLSGQFRITAASYPGHGLRAGEPFAAELGEIACELFSALADFDGLLYIFGHSLGALVGFELSWRLQAAGRPPVMFFASAAVAPHRHLPYSFSPRTMSDDELLGLLEACDGLPEGIADDLDLLHHALRVCRADIALAHEYSFGDESRKLSVPIVAIGGARDPFVSVGELGHWAGLSTRGGTVRIFPSGHFYYLDCALAVAELIYRYIDGQMVGDTGQEVQNVH